MKTIVKRASGILTVVIGITVLLFSRNSFTNREIRCPGPPLRYNMSVTSKPKYRKPRHKEQVIEEGKHYTLFKECMGKHKYKFICRIKDDNGDKIMDDIVKEHWTAPTITESEDIITIHFSCGTDSFMDKFIDYKNNMESNWINNVRGIGDHTVAFVYGGWASGEKSKIMIKMKYGNSPKKEYLFPHFIYDADVDICRFQNDDKELYLHYIDKDTKEAKEVVIPVSEFW